MKVFITNKKKVFIFLSVVLTGLIAVLCVIYCKTQSTAASTNSLPIYSVDTDKKQVAISFDAAWGNEDTEDLLKIFKENNVPATFFLVGEWVDKYPEDVKKIYNAGHTLGNHSATHPYLTTLTQEDITKEVNTCNEKIKKLTGKSPTLIRVPYGDYDNKVINTIDSLNMYSIQWDVDSLDWQGISADEIERNVMDKVKNGSIVLFHNAADHTPEALPNIIRELKADGYEFVKIDELIYKDNYYIDVTGKQIQNKAK